MAVISILSLLCVFSLTGCINDEPEPYWSLGPGDQLPEFTIHVLDGNLISTDSFNGSKGVIIFFSIYCQDCIREMPVLENAYREFMATVSDEDTKILCICRDEDKEAILGFINDYDITMPVAVDSGRSVYSMFASAGVPRAYVINEGIITESYLENIPDNIFR